MGRPNVVIATSFLTSAAAAWLKEGDELEAVNGEPLDGFKAGLMAVWVLHTVRPLCGHVDLLTCEIGEGDGARAEVWG